MFWNRRAWWPVGVLLAAALPALGADLAKIPRSIAKEPTYASGQPRYCLIVFGPEAEQRFWLVRDGDRYFFDRNRNGDLTDADECWSKPKPTKKRGLVAALLGLEDDDEPRAEFGLKVGAKSTDATLAITSEGGFESLFLHYEPVGYEGAGEDGAGKLQFAKSAATAPIVHFGGKLSLGFDEPYRLMRDKPTEIYVRIGTPGLGAGTFAYRSYRGVPGNVHPQVLVEFPSESQGAPPLREKFTLDDRC